MYKAFFLSIGLVLAGCTTNVYEAVPAGTAVDPAPESELDMHPGGPLNTDSPGRLGRSSPPVLLPSVPGAFSKPFRILNLTSASIANPEVLTVSIDSVVSTAGNNPSIYDIKANIIWGNGAGQVAAVIDMIQGTRVTFPASNVTVDVIAQYLGLIANPDPPTVIYSASVGYGAKGHGIAPTYTVKMIDCSNIAGREIIVPKFAKQFIPILENPAATSHIFQGDWELLLPASSYTPISIHQNLNTDAEGNPVIQIIGSVNGSGVGALFLLDL